MTTLNWVWPPLMTALALWMSAQVRRSVTGRARWMLVPVIAVLLLASLGATYANIRLADDDVHAAAPGQLYDVGGHRLHLDCHGHGSPTVVLSNGLGGISAGWARISAPVAEATRVCAYDRARRGWSHEAVSPQDGVQSAEDLHTLLAAAGEDGSYVLVGHSSTHRPGRLDAKGRSSSATAARRLRPGRGRGRGRGRGCSWSPVLGGTTDTPRLPDPLNIRSHERESGQTLPTGATSRPCGRGEQQRSRPGSRAVLRPRRQHAGRRGP
jgi:hypothetical protein